MKKIFIILILLIFAEGAVTALPLRKKEIKEPPEISYLNIEWWKNFKDDILTAHLMNLYKNNYDLKNAQLKIQENEKLVKMALSNELPSITLDGYLGRDFRSSVQRYGNMVIPSYAQNNFQFPLTMSYEIDIWGKNRLKTKSAKQQLEIVKQAERATYITLTSDFSADYFNLIKTDKLIEIQEELVKLQEDIVSKVILKNQAGLCSIEEVLTEEKILTSAKEELNTLKDAQEVLLNSLRVYLSLKGGDVERSGFSNLSLMSDIADEYNSDIINMRPDFLQREYNIKKIGYDVKAARREFLPNFVIFGQIGLNSYHFSDLFSKPTQLANAGIMPTLDLFSGGRKAAFLKLQKYRADEAINDYQKTILEDIKEVNNAISELKTSRKNYDETLNRFATQEKLYNLIKDKEQIGSASALDTLYGREAYLVTEKEKVSKAVDCVISTISLYKSTGGQNLYKVAEKL